MDNNDNETNVKFMNIALDLAKEALQAQEVPVGCVFVISSSLEIIAKGRNEVNETKNPTRHAEFVCIDRVVEHCNSNNLDFKDVFKTLSVYVTVEPCIMCADILHSLGIQKVVYGCNNDRFGGSTVFNVAELHSKPYEQIGGLMSDEAMDLLKQFYKGTNPSAPESKQKKKKKSQ